MKKSTRLLCIVLSLLMVISMLPVTAFASTTSGFTNSTTSVNYTSLADAVNAAAAGDTIVLYQDVDKLPFIDKALTLEGNTSVNVSGTADENQFGSIEGTVTLKNLVFTTGNGAIRTDYLSYDHSKLKLVIDNCTFNNLTSYAIMGGKADPDNHLLGELVVNKCTFNSVGTNKNYMVYAQCVGKLTVSGCVFNGAGTTKGAIHTGDSTAYATVADITGNEISGVARSVQVGNRVEGSAVTIDDNIFTSVVANETTSTTGVIYIHANADANVVVAVTDNTVTDSTYVIYNDGNDDITQIVTTCEGNTKDGTLIYMSDTGADTSVASDNSQTGVAQIGNTYYATLAEAINAAEAGDTVKLLCNTEGAGIVFETDDNVVIDLNGFTYTLNDSVGSSAQYGTVGFYLRDGSTVTIKNGTIAMVEDVNGDDVTFFKMFHTYGDLTLTDVTLDCANGVWWNGTKDTDVGFIAVESDNGTVAINGTTSIINCSSLSSETWTVVAYKYGAVTIDTTGTVDGVIVAYNANASVLIKNGNFINSNTEYDQLTVISSGNLSVTGGTFSEDFSAYCAEGYASVDNGENYTIAEAIAQNVETGTGYATVQAAINAANAGDTVQLVEDVQESMVTVKGGITLDLNGKTLTSDYIVAFNGNNVIDGDGTQATGVLKVAAENIMLAENNAQVPVYDAANNGYIFTSLKFATDTPEESITSNSFTFNFIPAFNMKVVELLKDGAVDNQVKVVVKVTWVSNGINNTQYFEMSEELIKTVTNTNEGTETKYGQMYQFNVYGIESFTDVNVSTVFVSDLGALRSSTPENVK